MDELRALNSSPRQNQSTVNKPSSIDSRPGDTQEASIANQSSTSALAANGVNKQNAIENAYGVNQRQDSATEETVSTEDKQEAVKKLNDYVQNVQRSLEFNFDEEAGKSVVKVIDSSTNEVIRQIPDEVAVELARNLNEDNSVSLFSTKA